MKYLFPLLVVILLVSTSFVGVSNTAIELEMKQFSTHNGGLMNSSWPMKCHDTHHTGRSPYGTTNNSYYELWRYEFSYKVDSDPAIGEDGTIYIGGSEGKLPWYLFAINPNGTLKWSYRTEGLIWHMCPTITENSTVYFGSWDGCLHAVNPNGTKKWKFRVNDDITSDPVVGDDGTVYFGTLWGLGDGGEIYAVNPDGSEKWCYKTGDYVSSDPAIGEDGTIYVGSGDSHLYAMNPNGTVKWKFKTGDEIYAPPSIAEDDTIYIGSWDGYLYALYPNGTLRWRSKIWYGSSTNPSIGLDGTIYICSASKLFAINPEDGSIKWEFNLGGNVMKSSSAICADGIIYTGIEIGDRKGGEIVSVNPDGTLRGRMRLSDYWLDSSPCIGEDGIIYVVASNSGNSALHAIRMGSDLGADANGPYYGLINNPVNFSSTVSGSPPYQWHWDFGDGETSDEKNPSHVYENPGKYTVTLNVSDSTGNLTWNITWAWIQESNSPPEKPTITGETKGKVKEAYDYTFKSSDPDGLYVWLYIDWDEGIEYYWSGPYQSGEEVTKSRGWTIWGTYTIRCKARDPYGAESDWAYLDVTVPKTYNPIWWLYSLLDRFPLLQRLLDSLMDWRYG